MAYNFGNGQLSVTIKHFLCFFYLQRYGSTDLNKFLSIKIKTKQQQQQKKTVISRSNLAKIPVVKK